MRKIALILGMFIALTFMSMNSVQAETTTWEITSHCVHDTNDVCLTEDPAIESFVMTIDAKYEDGDYGTIEMDNDAQIKYSLTELEHSSTKSNYKIFYFKGVDEQSVECLFTVTFYYKDRNFHVYLTVQYPDKILNWIGELLELEEPKLEAHVR